MALLNPFKNLLKTGKKTSGEKIVRSTFPVDLERKKKKGRGDKEEGGLTENVLSKRSIEEIPSGGEPKREGTPLRGRVRSFKKGGWDFSQRLLMAPVISEKATRLSGKGIYVFRVSTRAHKGEVRKAVEKRYGVRVARISLIRIPSKRRRLGRTYGYKPGFKKAVVILERGNTIELLPH